MPLNAAVSTQSRPVIHHRLVLSTHLGLKTYNRTFPRVEAALYLADVVVRVQGRASGDYAAEIAQVNGAIDRELERLDGLITSQFNRIEKILRKADPPPPEEEPSVCYTRPVQVELAMRTPTVRRYARLLGMLEHTLCKLDQAWYAGVISTAEQLQHGNHLFRNFYRTTGATERLARGLARRVRDDSELPGYREMLIKRTGRGLDDDEGTPVPAEGAQEMTVDEANSLQATEALVADLSAAPAGSDPTAPDRSPAPSEPLVAGAGVVEPGAEPGPLAAGAPAEPDTSAGPSDEEGAIEADTADAADAEEAALAAAASGADWPAEPLAPDAAGTRRRRLREVLGGARAAG